MIALLTATALSGCVSEEAQPFTHVLGENGSVAFGWAYDGMGIQPLDGFIWVDVDAVANSGTIQAQVTMANGVHVVIDFTEFSGSQDFHSGGIATNFIEHGASGVGDTSIPSVDLALAAWGRATVLEDDVPTPDPVTGGADFIAHLMVIRNGVRDDDTGAIYKADGATPFDPTDAADGLNTPGDWEIHLVLKGGAANESMPQDLGTIQASNANNAQYSMSHSDPSYSFPMGADVVLTATVQSTAPAQSTQLLFEVLDPIGAVVTSATVNGGGSGDLSFAAAEAGDYTIRVSGRAVTATYSVAGTSQIQEFLAYSWWEDVLFDDEAESQFEMLGGQHAHDDDASNMTALQRSW